MINERWIKKIKCEAELSISHDLRDTWIVSELALLGFLLVCEQLTVQEFERLLGVSWDEAGV